MAIRVLQAFAGQRGAPGGGPEHEATRHLVGRGPKSVAGALAREGQLDQSVPVAAADKYQINDVQAAPEQTSDPGVA
jgi:hypothetical protein